MNPIEPAERRRLVGFCWIAAAVLVGLAFAVNGRWGFNFYDEGFLYYGVLRVLEGEIPVADFQSYDPYRYYWAAAWTLLLGDSLYAVRAATAIFASIGLGLGLLAASRATHRIAELTLIGFVIVCWMFPHWKLYDIATSLIGVWAGIRVLEARTRRRVFAVGLLVGLMAGFGRNHGLYLAVGVGACVACVSIGEGWRRAASNFAAFAAGIVLGYAPILAHWTLVPGYLDAFVEEIGLLLWTGQTNLSVPILWPWRVDVSNQPWPTTIHLIGTGVFELLVPMLYLVAATALLAMRPARTGSARLTLAGLCIGLPYLHVLFSMPDYNHLAQSIHPALLVTTGLLFMWSRSGRHSRAARGVAIGVILASIAVNLPRIPRVDFAISNQHAVDTEIGGAVLALRPWEASSISMLRRFAETIDESEAFFAGPHLPMLYAVLGRQAPSREIYQTSPKPRHLQERFIEELETAGTSWLLLANVRFGGRRYPRYLPLVRDYFDDNFEPVPTRGLPVGWQLYRRVSGGSLVEDQGW